MVERLLDLGLDVVVWNRTPARCDAALARGARRVDTLAQLAQSCDVAGLCLADGAAVEAAAAQLLAPGASRMRAVADFSTIDPALAVALCGRAAEIGVAWVDCPVSGGVPAARAGALIGFAGGDAQAIDALRPLTDALFAKVTTMGGPGAGQLAKLCNQVIVAANVLVMAEALAAARAVGVDVQRLPQALAGGFADSKPLQIFGPRMAGHVFEPRMGSIRLMRKDVHLALARSRAQGLALPMLERAAQVYDRVGETLGMSLDDDISSVIRLLEPLAPEAV